MNEQVERKCPVCGIIYYADPTRLKHGRQTTCSRTCSYDLRAAKLENSQPYQCGACGQTILRSPAQLKSRHGLYFCSSKCAYSRRHRIVEKPYVRVAVVDYERATQKAWETRRRNAKPYPETARQKATARAIQRIQQGGGVSKFERKASKVFIALGFNVLPSVVVRNTLGQFEYVFDLLLPARSIIIECHGTYWHGGRWTWDTPDASQIKNLSYEIRKTIFAHSLGFELRILWEHEFKKDPCGACLAVVR